MAALSLLLPLYSLAQTSAPAAKKPLKAAPEFALKDSEGKVMKLSDYKGKVVLLNFWATWCGPCKLEMPWFMEFEKTYKDKGFAVLGVAMDDEGWDAVKPYLLKNKVTYRIAVGDEALATKYGGVESMPTSFVIDKQGRIVATHVGLVSKKDYQDDIEKLLGPAKVVAPKRTSVPARPRGQLGAE